MGGDGYRSLNHYVKSRRVTRFRHQVTASPLPSQVKQPYC